MTNNRVLILTVTGTMFMFVYAFMYKILNDKQSSVLLFTGIDDHSAWEMLDTYGTEGKVSICGHILCVITLIGKMYQVVVGS